MYKPTSCVVIDDESKAVSVISSIIQGIAELDLKQAFTDPCEALMRIPDIQPEIIFVDIDMPVKNGFELMDDLRLLGLKARFVFTTGYDEFALKAIKKQAFDYLLKPIDKSSILELLARSRTQTDYNRPVHRQTNGRIRFNTLNGFFVIEKEEILYVQADGNYSELYLRDGSSKLITFNLAKIESLLDSMSFKRIGRSTIINIDFLTQVDRRNGVCILKTQAGVVKLSITKKNIKELGELFN